MLLSNLHPKADKYLLCSHRVVVLSCFAIELVMVSSAEAEANAIHAQVEETCKRLMIPTDIWPERVNKNNIGSSREREMGESGEREEEGEGLDGGELKGGHPIWAQCIHTHASKFACAQDDLTCACLRICRSLSFHGWHGTRLTLIHSFIAWHTSR